MAEHNNILDDEDFIKTQEMNSVSMKQKKKNLVYDKPDLVLYIQEVKEPAFFY